MHCRRSFPQYRSMIKIIAASGFLKVKSIVIGAVTGIKMPNQQAITRQGSIKTNILPVFEDEKSIVYRTITPDPVGSCLGFKIENAQSKCIERDRDQGQPIYFLLTPGISM